MPYLAIKKVKGRYYGYMQESYREGGSVRTRTVEYLGAIKPAVAQQYQATRRQLGQADMAALVQSVRDASIAATRAPETPIEPPKAPVATDTPTTTPERPSARFQRMLVNGKFETVDTKTGELIETPQPVITTAQEEAKPALTFPKGFDQLPVGRHALQTAHRRYRERLVKLGIDPATMPTVSFAYGHPDGLKRNRDGSFTVTVSRNPKRRSPIRRDLLWQHYRQALAQGYLATIEAEQPELHHQLHTTLSRSHNAAKRLLWEAIAHAPDQRLGIGLSLHLLVWDRLPRSLAKKAEAKDYGQHSFDTINDWQGEAAFILAETSKRGGWNNVLGSYQNTIRKHKAMITRRKNDLAEAGLLDRLSGKRRKILRQIVEAETKLAAVKNLKARAQLLRRVLVV